MINIPFNSGAIDASGAIGQGWELIKKNYWMYFGISLLAWVMIACIPLVSLFLFGPVMVGIYYVLQREQRGEPVEFGMMFKGFEKFVPAMVVGLIQNIPTIIFQIFQWTFDIGRFMMMNNASSSRGRGGDPDLGPLALISGVYLIFLLGFLVFLLVWHFSFYFTMQLLAEHDGLGAIDAIKLSARAAFSNAGGLILLMILEGLLMIAGAIACGIGMFFVIPIIYAANATAYRYVFPPVTPSYQNNAPPPPDVYGGSYGQGM
jgi:uncharacterized membrane protein